MRSRRGIAAAAQHAPPAPAAASPLAVTSALAAGEDSTLMTPPMASEPYSALPGRA